MLRKALVLGLVLSPGLAGSVVALAAGPFFAEEPPEVAGAPFSAVAKTESVTAFADGNRIVRTFTVHYFRDGQGRTRTERANGPNSVITINDPVGGMHYVIRPEHKAVFAYKTGPGGTVLPSPIAPTDDLAPFGLLGFGMSVGAAPSTEASSETTSLGQKSISGVTAIGTRLVRHIPSGVIGNEKPITSTLDRWVSPDLGIAVQIDQKSSIGGELTLNMGQVARAEPDPTLFVPPAGYTRRDVTLPGGVAGVPMASQTLAVGAPAVITAVKKNP